MVCKKMLYVIPYVIHSAFCPLKQKGANMSVGPKKRSDGTTAWFYDFTYRGKRHRAV